MIFQINKSALYQIEPIYFPLMLLVLKNLKYQIIYFIYIYMTKIVKICFIFIYTTSYST